MTKKWEDVYPPPDDGEELSEADLIFFEDDAIKIEAEMTDEEKKIRSEALERVHNRILGWLFGG